MDVPSRIEVEGGRRIELTWDDGTVSSLAARDLRAACECATCREPSGQQATQAVLDRSDQIEVLDAKLVGAYALNFTFAPDDHHTGIYPFDRLRRLAETPQEA